MATATDNFNRANSADLGSNWTKHVGTTARHGVLDNQCDWNSDDCGDYYSATSFGGDQYSEALIVNLAARSHAVTVRSVTSGSNAEYYAGGHDFWNTGNTRYRLWKRVAGVYSAVAVHATDSPTVGETLRLEASGTTITLKANGVAKVSTTDASLSTGQPGIYSYEATANIKLFDDWGGGDLGGAVTVPRFAYSYRRRRVQ